MNEGQVTLDRAKFWNRFVALGLLSLFFYTSGLLVVAAFAPLTIGLLSFGKKLGLTLAGCCLATLGVLSLFMAITPIAIAGYALVIGLGYVVYEMITRDIGPDSLFTFVALAIALLVVGVFVTLSASLGFSYEVLADKILEAFIANMNQQGQKGADEMVTQLSEGLLLGQKVKFFFPSFVYIVLGFQTWLGLFMVLKFSAGWRRLVGYHHSIKELFEYRNPEFMVFPLILSLALFLLGHYAKMQTISVLAGNALLFMSVFYFFHGLGVYIAFLKYLRFGGLVKTVFFVLGFLFLNRILIVIGIFDYWVNFRKFFKKQEES